MHNCRRPKNRAIAGAICFLFFALARPGLAGQHRYQITDLGTFGGSTSSSSGINDAGQVIGSADLHSSPPVTNHAFLFTQGTLPAINAYAINDNGQIVGYAGGVDTGGPTIKHGFICSNGLMTDLGNLGSYWTNVLPFAINNQAQVVGSISGYATAGHAFLYREGTLTDLNNLIDPASGWTLLRANGINNNGQIAGTGKNPLGQDHALLLTPRPVLLDLQVSGSQARFALSGMTGAVYRVECAFSLPATNWGVLTNVALSSAPAQIVDEFQTTTRQRYYRAVQQ